MTRPSVLVVHARGEEGLAEKLAVPIESAGFEVTHRGRVAVGDSVVGETTRLLDGGARIVLCATAKALGTTWSHKVINAARDAGTPVFIVQMEAGVHVDGVRFGETVARYDEDPQSAIELLLAALGPGGQGVADVAELGRRTAARDRYRELALAAVDIIDLAGLPELDRNVALRQLELRRLYVPLRVRTEVGPEESIPDAKLQELEERRRESGVEEQESGRRSPLGTRLTASRRLVVLGDPGAGKTTIIRWLATAYLLRLQSDPEWDALPDVATLPKEDLLPIIIRCRDLDPEAVSGSLEDVLRRTFRKSEMTAEEADTLMVAFREDLTEGRALLLVDGLDEIQDSGQRAKFCAQIERICLAYPRTWIVATSRIVGYREMGTRIGRGFEHVTIADLSSEDKDLFASRWCALTEPPDRQESAAVELISDIHSADRIERLTGNPMLLTTMALVKRKIGKLPDGRAELYGDAVDVLLRWRQEIDEAIDQREALPQLQYIAYAMCERGVQQLGEDDVLELLERMREEYPQIRPLQNHTTVEFLRLLERKTGILVQVGQVRQAGSMQPVYEFRHLTIQEYLAATALVKGRYPGRVAGRTLADAMAPLASLSGADDPESGEASIAENWRETLSLCVSVCEDDDVDAAICAIATLLSTDEPSVRRPRAVLAARCLLDEPNVSDGVVADVLAVLCDVVEERDGGPLMLETPVSATVYMIGRSRWEQPLLEALNAAFRCADLPRRLALGRLVTLVATSLSAESPARLRSWLEEQALALAGPSEDFIASALALSGVGSSFGDWPYGTSDLLERWPDLIGRVTDLLLQKISGGEHEQTAALLALVRLAQTRFDVERDEPVDTMLADLAGDRGAPIELRLLALEASDSGFVSPSMTAVLKACLSDPASRIRAAAAHGLRYSSDPGVRSDIVTLVDDPEPRTRQIVAEMAGADDVDVIRTLCADPDPSVQRAACRQAVSVQGAAVPLVLDLLAEGDACTGFVLQALRMDSAIGDYVPALLHLVSSGAPEHRLWAVEALGTLAAHPAARDKVREVSHGPEPELRAACARGLLKMGEEGAADLARLAEDVDERVRFAVVTASTAYGQSPAIDRLLSTLRDRSPAVARRAAAALLEHGDKDVLATVAEYLGTLDGAALSEVVPYRVGAAAMSTLAALLPKTDAEGRRVILGALVRTSKAEEDAILLSLDFDGLSPFIDPEQPISAERVRNAAVVLSTDEATITGRYRELAAWLPIALLEE
jgi:HEAT repeat protein